MATAPALAALASLAAIATAGDPCECLEWAPLYQPRPGQFPRVLCGEGLELVTFAASSGMDPKAGYDLPAAAYAPLFLGGTYVEFCAGFFHQMRNNYCVNVGMEEYGTGGFQGGAWCYVSKECTELNGGQSIRDKESFYFGPDWVQQYAFARKFFDYITPKKPVPRDLSWKMCTKGKDKRLRDMEPLEVMDLAKKQNSVIGFVTKIAYQRLMPPQHTWDTVKAAVQAGDMAKLPAILKKAIEDEEPIVIDIDPEGHTHQRIIKGKQIFELENQCTPMECGGKHWPYKRGRDVGEL
eukprot:gnl/TRDRNA2_/TRDRNA2_169016_c2_seq1.p1 gnl/TRDRNA2_/TRDRNA2_169016_c2~~gnl/TRDRNA2_/TRDRNA2_169016_c2_seq1.p1  ORF type:complete len:303 (+),score=57.81 gnl/TRDRNA2_/TRDRNA2_169016_c2_seq1:27-911(+)